MPDKSKKFHEFALKSILFKGRSDWYFCYLKTERIAHVLALLSGRSGSPSLKDIAEHAASLPGEIARLAAGELSPAMVLAEVFVLLADVRLAGTAGVVGTDNSLVLVREYEQVAERLAAGTHLSPFVGPEDFFTPDVGDSPLLLQKTELGSSPLSVYSRAPRQEIKDIKGQSKGHTPSVSDRVSLILQHIRKHKSVSIKEVAAMVPDCSEKTVQRELNSLIAQGLVRRVGSRRWSLYEPVE
ncbi:MAG: DeoR family transcriptional regulator [Patescibacteria group bacterium]